MSEIADLIKVMQEQMQRQDRGTSPAAAHCDATTTG